jgi:hypothetical protein
VKDANVSKRRSQASKHRWPSGRHQAAIFILQFRQQPNQGQQIHQIHPFTHPSSSSSPAPAYTKARIGRWVAAAAAAKVAANQHQKSFIHSIRSIHFHIS